MNRDKCIMIQINEIDDIKKFANIVTTFNSDVNIYSGSGAYDAKSLMAIFALDTSSPKYVEIMSKDEEEIKEFFTKMKQFEC